MATPLSSPIQIDIDTRRRFHEKINRNGPIPAHFPALGRCHIWTAARKPEGYGKFGINGHTLAAHRIAYVFAHGRPLPDDVDVLHRCDNPPCVRPAHLFEGTRGDNNQDRHNKGRSARGEAKSHLKEEQVIWLRTENAKGTRPLLEMALELGISRCNAYAIVKGESWQHVGGPLVTERGKVCGYSARHSTRVYASGDAHWTKRRKRP